MSDERGSFWSSLGGVLTGVAAVLTAIAGLVGVIYSLPHLDTRSSVPGSSEQSAPRATQEPKTPEPSSTRADTVEPTEKTPSHTTTQPSRRISVGDNVIARWSDDCFYSATVVKTHEGNYFVQYDFSGEDWVRSENVFVILPPGTSQLPLGTEVYAKPDKQHSKWLSSTVVRSEDGKYLLSVAKNKCLDGPGYIWANADQIVTAH